MHMQIVVGLGRMMSVCNDIGQSVNPSFMSTLVRLICGTNRFDEATWDVR